MIVSLVNHAADTLSVNDTDGAVQSGINAVLIIDHWFEFHALSIARTNREQALHCEQLYDHGIDTVVVVLQDLNIGAELLDPYTVYRQLANHHAS